MKRLLLLSLLLASFFGLRAQQGFHIGVYGMPQNTWIFNDQTFDPDLSAFEYEVTWGWAAMGKIGYNFADPIGLHLACLFSKQGQISTALDSLGLRIQTERELTYVKIPLLIHINSDPGRVMLNMEIGPQLGLLMDAQHAQDGVAQQIANISADNYYKAQDIGIAWAIGAEFMLTDFMSFILQHRGDYSLFDIENKQFLLNQSLIDPDRDSSNGCVLGIMGGFNFHFMPRGGGRNVKFWIR